MRTKHLVIIIVILVSSAVSAATTYYVDPNGDDDNNGLSWATAFKTIQKGVDVTDNGDIVEVNEGVYYENVDFSGQKITLRSTDPNDWTVVGSTIICANNPSGATVTFDDSEDACSVIAGFKITGGLCGVECDGSSPVVRNCIIAQNGSENSSGGGIYIHDCGYYLAGPLIANCFIVDNDANCGGGIYNATSKAVYSNCVISENFANSYGGGLYNCAPSQGDFYCPSIENCTIINNTAGYCGGGMYSQGRSEAEVKNCIFWYNSAGSEGDEICNNEGAYPEFEYCNISGSGGSQNWRDEIGNDHGINIDSLPFFKLVEFAEEGAVARWALDEGSNTIAYDSIGSNDGNVCGGAVWTSGQIDSALNFDGINDSVEVPDNNNLDITGDITITAWVYFRQGTREQAIVTKTYNNGAQNNPYDFRTTGQNEPHLMLVRADASSHEYEISTQGLSLNQWHHVVVTVDNNVVDFYADGGITGQYGDGILTKTPTSNSRPMRIGRRDDGLYLNGVIDEVAIYNRALSSQEIRQLYLNGLIGKYKYHLNYNSPCRNTGITNNDANEVDIDNEIRVREGCIDIGADEYVTPEFPYICSFEKYQGFNGLSSGVRDWEVSGYTMLFYADFNDNGVSQYYQYIHMVRDANFSRIFVTKETDNNHVRVSCIPYPGSQIDIRKDNTTIASVLFDSNSDRVCVLNNGNYEDSGMAYQATAHQCRTFLHNTDACLPGYSYENTWIELQFIFNWQSGYYDVHWRAYNNPGSFIKTGAVFNAACSTFSEIRFEIRGTSDVCGLELNRISISDESEAGGDFGQDEDIWITSPVADWQEPLEGFYNIIGSVWYDKLGRYEVKICPTSEDPCETIEVAGGKMDHWLLVHEGNNVVADDDVLGYLSTAKFFNGDYYMRIFLYDDLNRLKNPLVDDNDPNAWKNGCIKKMVYYNGGGHECVAEYPIIGRLKGGQTYHFGERPDITINWPGSFPFEFRRIYDSSLRKQLFPLFFGWTHNHNIRIYESTKTDWEPNEADPCKPDTDSQGLGIGRLYLLMPLGGRAFDGYVDETDPTGKTIIYEPIDNEPDYIRRASAVRAGEQEFDVNYVYYGPDGMEYTFEKTDIALSYEPAAGEGAVDWQVYVGIDRQEDRFGNALVYQWDGQEIFVTEIQSEVDGELTGVKIVFDCNSLGGWSDGPALYKRIGVNDGSGPTIACYDYNVVGIGGYDPTYGITAVEEYRYWDGGYLDKGCWSHWNGNLYRYEYYEDGFVIYRAPDFYVNGPDAIGAHAFGADLYYGGDGSLLSKYISVGEEAMSVPEYTYREKYSDNYDEQGNLISTTEFSNGPEYNFEIYESRYKIDKTIRSPIGAVLRQESRVYTTSDSSYDNCFYSVAGGGGVCDVEYLYEDERFPLKPTAVLEYFDDDGDGTYDRPARTTKLAYDDRGNIVQKKVYADPNNFVLTEYEYHPKYNFPVRQTAWQDYCTQDANGIEGKKVEQRWVYGDDDGTEDPNGAYLVQQKTLLDSSGSDWAVTKYTYYADGQLKTVENPATPQTGTYYLCDDRGFVTKMWEGVDVTAGQPQTAPQKRYYYNNGLGRVELEGDYLGQVKLYTYDNVGNVTSLKTFEDSNAMSLGDFEPDSYSGGFVKLQKFREYNWNHGCQIEQLDTGGKIWHTYWHGKYPLDLYDCNTASISKFESLVYPYPWPSGQIVGTETQGVGPKIFHKENFYFDSMDRVCRKVTFSCPYDADFNHYRKYEKYSYYGNGRIKNEEVYNIFYPYSVPDESTLEKSVNYFYDSLDRLIKKVEDPDPPGNGLNITTQYGCDAVGNKLYAVDPNGNIIFADFDQANRQVCEYYPKPAVYYPGTTDVDVNSSRDGVIKKRQVEYYKDSRIESVTSYDTDGQTILAQSQFAYDERGRIEDVNQYISAGQAPAETKYQYADAGQELTDANGDKYHIKITDAENQETYIALDIDGSTKKTLYPSGHYEQIENIYLYQWIPAISPYPYQEIGDDCNGHWNVTAEIRKTTGQIDGDSQTIIYKKDKFGSITEVNYPDGGHLQFAYDVPELKDYQKVIEINDCRTDKPGEPNDLLLYQYAYDYRTGGVKQFAVVKNDVNQYIIDYNNLVAYPGQRKQIRVRRPDPNNPADSQMVYYVNYKYDGAGRLCEVNDLLVPGANQSNVAGFGYDENGNRTALEYYLDGTYNGPTISMAYTYNNRNLLTAVTTSGGPTYSFNIPDPCIDGLGRLIEATETISYPGQADRSHTNKYIYNMQSGLTRAGITNVNGLTWTALYIYKKDGNIWQKRIYHGPPKFINYEYDTTEGGGVFDSDIMTKADGNELFWDDNGRLAETPAFSFEYNWDGKLSEVFDSNEDLVMSLKYDPMGNRVWKQTITDGNATSRNYIVDIAGGLPTILIELDPCAAPDSSLKKAYVYTPQGQILAQYDCNGYDEETNSVIVNNKFFYVHDRLGSVRLVIDINSTVRNSYTYTPFGEMFAAECNETVYNPFKFTGQWYDSEIGQYYLRARQYDPVLMRFTSRDSVKGGGNEPLTMHLYLYCLNNPINNIDPTGFSVEDYFDPMRRPYLEHEGRQFEELNRQGVVSGLGAMIALTDLAAWFTKTDRTQFVEDLLWMFTERTGPFFERGKNLNLQFDSTGFASRYQDGYPGQVRHFIGSMAAGYYWGAAGGRSLVIANEIFGTLTYEDFVLGFAGVDLGVQISGSVYIDPFTHQVTRIDPMAIGDVGDWMHNNLGK